MGPPAAGAGHAHAAEGELLVQLVHESVGVAVVLTDVDGVVRSWNRGAARLTGWEAPEVVGTPIARLYCPEDVEAGLVERHLATAAAGPADFEGWRLRKDGSRFWTRLSVTALRGDDGRLLAFGWVGRDLSARKHTVDALRESERRFRVLVDSLTDHAVFRLSPTGEVTSWNLGAERLKGWGRDEILGRSFEVFYSEEDRADGKPAAGLRRALAEGRSETEGWRYRKDGSRFWADVVITALFDADGNHDGFAKVTRDLSDRKQAEDALRDVLERERAAAARLRELDDLRNDLVAVVAHDMRGPLAVVNGFAELLLADWEQMADAERRDVLRRMADRTAKLSAFVDDVFDTARIEAGQLTLQRGPVDVAQLVRRVADDVASTHPDRRLELRVPEGLPAVHADEQRLWQVLDNLVSNAIKFSPASSAVGIEVEAGDGEVVVAVSDHGPGVPAEEAPLLFQRFTRLPGTTAPGTGMGLFIARTLTEAHGGRIWVEPRPDGGGATFRFSLPLEG